MFGFLNKREKTVSLTAKEVSPLVKDLNLQADGILDKVKVLSETSSAD